MAVRVRYTLLSRATVNKSAITPLINENEAGFVWPELPRFVLDLLFFSSIQIELFELKTFLFSKFKNNKHICLTLK